MMIHPVSTHALTGLLPASGGSASKTATAAEACHIPRGRAAGAIRKPPAVALQSHLSRTNRPPSPAHRDRRSSTRPDTGGRPAKALVPTRLADQRTMRCTSPGGAGAGRRDLRLAAESCTRAQCALPARAWRGGGSRAAAQARTAPVQSGSRAGGPTRKRVPGARGCCTRACVLLLRARRAHDVPAGCHCTVPTRTGDWRGGGGEDVNALRPRALGSRSAAARVGA